MTSALAEPPWCVCSACLGTPAVFTLGVMQLAALLGIPCWLTQVGCSTPAVMVSHGVGGCLVTVVLFPPCFLFLCLRSFPLGVLPPYRMGWHVCLQFAGLLFGVAGGDLLRLFSQCLCAVFPAAGTLGFLGFCCSACLLGWLWLCTLCQGVPVAVLSAWFAGGVPLLPFPYLRWVYFWLRCLQSLWATMAVSAALRGSSSSSSV